MNANDMESTTVPLLPPVEPPGPSSDNTPTHDHDIFAEATMPTLENESPWQPSNITNKNSAMNDVLEDIETRDADGVADDGGDVANNSDDVDGAIGKKHNFPSAVPTQQKFTNQEYESYEMGYDSDGGLIPFDKKADIWGDPDDFLDEAIAELRITDAVLAPAPAPATSGLSPT